MSSAPRNALKAATGSAKRGRALERRAHLDQAVVALEPIVG